MEQKRKLFSSLLVAATLCLTAVPSAHAQENKIPSAYVEDTEQDNLWVTLSMPFYNKYYYRGIELYPEASFQPSFSINYALGDYGTIGASVWSHIPMADDQGSLTFYDQQGNLFKGELANKFVEVDPSVSYDISFGAFTFSVGHIWYTDPHEGKINAVEAGVPFTVTPAPDTAEVYGGIAIDTFLQPTLTVYHDYRAFDYQYYGLSFSERLDEEVLGEFFGEGFNITPYVLFGFATGAEKSYNDADGLKHINLGVRSTMYLGKVRVTPVLQYNFGLDDDIDGVERTDNDFIFGIDFAIDGAFSL